MSSPLTPERRRSLAVGLALTWLAAGPLPARALEFTQGDTLTGFFADDQFGWALTGLEDLDGDGLGDLAVSARFYLVGADTAAGAVFVYPGGRSPNDPPLARLEGLTQHEHFGESLAGGRDVDGNGRPDLAVGAPLRDVDGMRAAGAVDLFLGEPGAFPDRWTTLEGEADDDWFGQSVALGDLDGDGDAEVIVGAPFADQNGSAAGAVYLYRGGPTPPAAPFLTLLGEASNDQFGWAVAHLGDVDGDGFGDLAVGARLHGEGPMRARGKVYLYRGGAAMDSLCDGSWLGEASDDWFGHALAGPGDVDGGGAPDLLVGAPFNDRAGSAAGAAYLFRGEDPPGTAPVAVYEGESGDAQLGWSVGGGPDLTGDGRPDPVAGARFEDPEGRSAAGRVYLFPSGVPPLSVQPAATADGEQPDDWLGNSVAGAAGYFGDTDGAVAAGAPFHDVPASAAGRAYAWAGGSTVSVGGSVPGAARLRLWPNPVRDRLHLEWAGVSSGSEAVLLSVYDVRGRRLRGPVPIPVRDTFARFRWSLTGPTGERVAPGVYRIRLLDPSRDRSVTATTVVLPR